MGAPSNRTATLESQMIPMIQDVPGQTLRGKKEIIKTKLDEIGTVRNALAHFRPLKYDDVELIKQNVKHAFAGIEQCLSEMTQANRVVPTNTPAEWYKSLSTLGSKLCTVRLFQDKSDSWIRVEIGYECVILSNSGPGDYRSFRATNIVTPEIIKCYPVLAGVVTFITEYVPHIQVSTDNSPKIQKKVSFVFSKVSLLDHHVQVCDQIRELLLKVETESELVQQDNLARGDVVDTARISCSLRKEQNWSWWSTTADEMKSEFGENDPPEYWGEMSQYVNDFIAASQKYPWMPSDISKEENPFG